MRHGLPVLTLIVAATSAAAQPSMPQFDGAPVTRIAFGSCSDQDQPQPIWEAIVGFRPELFLYIGDNIYADTEDMAVMREKYARQSALPGYQKLKAIAPVLATWDDHDFGGNDVGAEYPKRAESQQLFLDFYGVSADSPLRTQEGVYHARVVGPPGKQVQVILLDTRYFRSPLVVRQPPEPRLGRYVPTTDTSTTMLGEAQWAWLDRQLETPAQIRIIVSSIALVAEDQGYEKWMNFPHERQRLFDLLKKHQSTGVIVISGDRHLAELSMMDAGLGYPLYDLASSGFNKASPFWRPFEVNRHRVATMNWGQNFGTILIDWDRPDPAIRLQIRDEEGEVTIQQKVFLSTLRPGVIRPRRTSETPPGAPQR